MKMAPPGQPRTSHEVAFQNFVMNEEVKETRLRIIERTVATRWQAARNGGGEKKHWRPR